MHGRRGVACDHDAVRNRSAVGAGCPRLHHTLHPSVVDDCDAVRDALQLVEIVRCDDDRALRASQFGQDVAKALRPHRIQTVRRLVENNELLVVQECLRQPNALKVPLRQLPDLLSPMFGEAETLDELLDARTHL
jgi:hypothetical protein